MGNEKAIERGKHYTGWQWAIPGFVACILLVLAPAIVALASLPYMHSITDPGAGVIHNLGGISIFRSIMGGLIGGIIAVILGITISWAMVGRKFKTPIFILLCLPIALGETTGAVIFSSMAEPFAVTFFLRESPVAMALFIAWRLTGPAALFATIIAESRKFVGPTEPLMLKYALKAGVRRWAFFAIATIFAGAMMAMSGAGNAFFAGGIDWDSPLLTPSEFVWALRGRAPLLLVLTAWPLYIVCAAIFLLSLLRIGWKTVIVERVEGETRDEVIVGEG